VSRYQKGKTNSGFYVTESRDSEWQWHYLGHIEVCTSLQTDNQARTPPLSFLLARCPSCCPTNNVKALKALEYTKNILKKTNTRKLYLNISNTAFYKVTNINFHSYNVSAA